MTAAVSRFRAVSDSGVSVWQSIASALADAANVRKSFAVTCLPAASRR